MKHLRDLDVPDLLDLVEIEDAKRDPDTCEHRHEVKTETDWGPPYGIRMTWTCACGRIRGRC